MEYIFTFFANISLFDDNPVDLSGAQTFLTTLFASIISFAGFIGAAALGYGIFKIGFKIHKASVDDDQEERKRAIINLVWCVAGFIVCMVAFGMSAAIAAGVPILGFNPPANG